MATTKPKVQMPNVAGMFYPAEREVLSETVNNLFAEVTLPNIDKKPRAIIVPHAGYVYSGLTAAYGFSALKPFADKIKRVVVLAPAHRYPFYGVAFSRANLFLTPLGEIEVDHDVLDKIEPLKQVQNVDQAFHGEHALEVELPFLQTVLEEFSLVPLLVGKTDANAIYEVLENLWDEKETIFVISSDLSHYFPYETAKEIDDKTAQAILNLDDGAIDHNQACGHLGVKAILKLAKAHGLDVTQLDLRNSGDTEGNKERVVGYGAFLFN